jgi:hypothetical protein
MECGHPLVRGARNQNELANIDRIRVPTTETPNTPLYLVQTGWMPKKRRHVGVGDSNRAGWHRANDHEFRHRLV